VNESVWEHLKLAFWPSLLFMLIEFKPLKKAAVNFAFAKTVGVCFMVAVIPVIFYSYTAFVGESIFAIDITTFIIAVIIGQLISYKLLTARKLPGWLTWLSIVILVLLALVFIVFTFSPPHLPIFNDPISGGYGMLLSI
jgi:hypothetical protein